jgi:hypothetical protein
MRGFRIGGVWATVLILMVLHGAQEAKAQLGFGGSMSQSAPPVPLSAGQYGPAGFPSNSPQSVATDPLGVGGISGQSNMFNNPFAAPLLYGGLMSTSPKSASASASSSSSTSSGSSPYGPGLSPQQMGFMMLATTPQVLGATAGQASGLRSPAGGGQAAGSLMLARAKGRAQQPGGLAAGYFNRTTKISRNPQSYFNRQTRYFPESGR